MKPKLIIVQGMPATGKTTLANKLSKDLNLSSIGKDTIKEFLFDQLGAEDREWSKALGAATSDFMYMLANACLSHNKPVILENAYQVAFARKPLQEVLSRHNAACLEIYCATEKETRIQRFIDRNESGNRHAGHVDHVNYGKLMNATEKDAEKYQPLKIGRLIEVDTTHFGDADYQKLKQVVNEFLHS